MPGLGVLPGIVRRLPDGVKRPQMQWNTWRRAEPPGCSPGCPTRCGPTSCTRSPPRTPTPRGGDVRLRRPGGGRGRGRGAVGHPVPPREVRAAAASPSWPTSSAGRRGGRRRRPDRAAWTCTPAIDLRATAGACASTRATTAGDRVRRRPGRPGAGVRRRRGAVAPRGRPRRRPHRRAPQPRRGGRHRRGRRRAGAGGRGRAATTPPPTRCSPPACAGWWSARRRLDDPGWVRRLAARHPGRVAVGLDARGRDVAVRGWVEGSGHDLVDVARRFDDAGVAPPWWSPRSAWTARSTGPDLDQLAGGARRHRPRRGRLGRRGDARRPAGAGRPRRRGRRLAGVIVGRALYEGAFTVAEAVERGGPCVASG